MCLYPKLIRNKKYTANKKNGGVIPAISDVRVTMVPVGCGKCMECRKKKSREWQVRLLEEVRTNKNGKMVTLTFSNESIQELTKEINKKGAKLEGYELDNEIATVATRRFLERWRKKHKKSLRHWFITELGHNGTENIHIHGIVWTNENREEVVNTWRYGWMFPRNDQQWKKSYVNEKTANYIVKYVHKVDQQHKEYTSKILTSPGIGKGYVDRADAERNKYNKKGETNEAYKTRNGGTIMLPIYWRNKIYTEEEREQLWLQKLDKQERWVCGERVDVSQTDEEYFKILNWHRERNKRLGYGDDEKNWERKRYEHQKRILKQKERGIKLEPQDAGGSYIGFNKPSAEGSAKARLPDLRCANANNDGAIKPNENNFIKNLE